MRRREESREDGPGVAVFGDPVKCLVGCLLGNQRECEDPKADASSSRGSQMSLRQAIAALQGTQGL